MSENETKRAALIAVSLSAFVTPMMLSGVNVALPAIAADLLVDAVSLSWIATLYLLATAVFVLPAGRLADMIGRKRIFVSGIVVVALGSLLAASSDSITQLLICRAIQGIGSAMLFPTGVAILTSVFSPQERGKVIGVNAAMVYTGISCGPFFGGWLTEHVSWRSVFVFYLPLVLVAIYLISARLEGEWKGPAGQRFDFAGALIFGVAACAFIYGLSVLTTPIGVAAILIGIVGTVVFVRLQNRLEHPLLAVSLLFDHQVFKFSCFAALLMYAAVFGSAFLLSLYLQYIKAMSPADAGLILLVLPIMMAICAPISGHLSDRYEPRVLSSIGITFNLVGLGLLALLDASSSFVYIGTCLVVMGVGFGIFSSPNSNAIMGSVEPEYYGSAAGVMSTTRVCGQMMSMGVVTLVFALNLGDVEITPTVYPTLMNSISTCFLIGACTCAVGIYFSLARGYLHPVSQNR